MGAYDRLKKAVEILPDTGKVTIGFGSRLLNDPTLNSMLDGLEMAGRTFEITHTSPMLRKQILHLIDTIESQPRPPYAIKEIEYYIDNPGPGGAKIVVTPQNITVTYVSHHSDKMSNTLKNLLTKFGARGILDVKIPLP